MRFYNILKHEKQIKQKIVEISLPAIEQLFAWYPPADQV